MKKYITGFLLVLTLITRAQTSNGELINELNRDIWIPFVKGVNSNDPVIYNAVNSKYFYWVTDGARPRIMNLGEYIEDARVVMQTRVAQGISSEIEIRFLTRTVTAEFASERCVVKFTAASSTGKTEIFYSIMQVFSRKESGVWKKWIQYALNEPVSKEQFDNAKPLE